MKLYKAKIKFYFASGYQKEVVHVSANDIDDAIKQIHDMYDQKSYGIPCPAFIMKIKEVK